MDWFRKEALISRKLPSEPEIIDADDKETYTDSDGVTEYKFPDSFGVVNYQDTWRADLTGRLWKKNSTTNKFEEYTDEQEINDAKSFEAKDGNCGKLCIFSDPEKCAEFFKRMTDQNDTLTTEELSKEINNPNFVRSYKDLKENIVKVNPNFVSATLRMFGFEKYFDLKDDATRTLKYESFTRWWGRYGSKLTLNPPTAASAFPKRHKGLEPEPPENLELFFKLLISFINNNEFYLNPQSKQLISKNNTLRTGNYGPPLKEFLVNGIKVPNKYYDKEVALYDGKNPESLSENPESLSGLVDMIRKNSLLGSRPINMGLPENRLNLNTLLGLLVGVTTGGKIRLGKELPYSTGKGYTVGGSNTKGNIVGGTNAKDILPCSKNALEIFKIGIDSLNKKNKKLEKGVKEKMTLEIEKLTELEREVYNNLYILANYIKVINVMNDEAANDDITLEIMNKAVDEYENKSNKLAAKSDSTISFLLKNLFENSKSGSYYGK